MAKLPLETIINKLKESKVSYPFVTLAYQSCDEKDWKELERQINILKLTGYDTGVNTREQYYELLESINMLEWDGSIPLPTTIQYFYNGDE